MVDSNYGRDLNMKLNTQNKFAILITTKGKENILLSLEKLKGVNIPIYIVTPEDYSQIKGVKIIKDKGKGKPEALNIAFKEIKEDILILTDGDVYTDKKSINNIIKNFDLQTGLITGKVISLNKKDNMIGYWSHFLTYAANTMRAKKYTNGEFFEGSGYLLAIRKNLIKNIDPNALADDGVISKIIYDSKYKEKYLEDSKVYVKYPDNFKDWIKQKKRSAGGYKQDITEKTYGNRSFLKEARYGIKIFFTYPKNFKEFFYTLVLFIARVYLWILIEIDIKILRKNPTDIWVRVESTK